ncbi:hypothetical protein FJY69_01590 [candidate division WOR-3 bacterium]|nr:hypothetical protein [candidate division WOR-3 bacterium]
MLAAVLLLVRALPASPARLLARLATLTYLLLRPRYRAEIRANHRTLVGRDSPWFWLANAWTVGRNLAIMARLDQRRCDAIVDRPMIYTDNICGSALERELHIAVVSFHFGLWECLPKAFARLGHSVALAVGRQRDPLLARQIDAIRQFETIELVSLKQALRRLRKPGLTGFVLDNTSRGGSLWTRCGSVEMRLPALPFEIATRKRLQLRAAFARIERGRLRIDLSPAGAEAEVLSALITQVRKNPAEWVFWGKAGALADAGPEAG